ncbi:SDR family NAD(P)-dependent oxidoreductase [Listeria floridensis]|nr:SDR family NAD(P)-dependent oxidoreductase [Listeria floridensis]
MTKTVLVTGGAGFIGSHLCEMYLKEGYKTICYDNFVSGKKENIEHLLNHENFHLKEADICDEAALEEVFEAYKPNIINHHAAQKSVPYSVENPLYDLHENLEGLLKIIACIKKYPIETFVFISSGGALSSMLEEGEQSSEDDKPQLISPYAITKFAGEQYIKLYAKELDFNFMILRYANVYGPRQVPDGESGVIPIFLNNIFAKKESVLMAFPDMPKGCTRDYVNVSDVVEANRLGTEHPINELVNIGSGKEEAILDIYEMILEVFQEDVPIRITGPRKGDIKRSVLAISRAGKLLDWKPKMSLRAGLENLKEFELDKQSFSKQI